MDILFDVDLGEPRLLRVRRGTKGRVRSLHTLRPFNTKLVCYVVRSILRIEDPTSGARLSYSMQLESCQHVFMDADHVTCQLEDTLVEGLFQRFEADSRSGLGNTNGK